jgi:hypothetical protein
VEHEPALRVAGIDAVEQEQVEVDVEVQAAERLPIVRGSRALLNAADTQWRPAFLVGLRCGLRLGESWRFGGKMWTSFRGGS